MLGGSGLVRGDGSQHICCAWCCLRELLRLQVTSRVQLSMNIERMRTNFHSTLNCSAASDALAAVAATTGALAQSIPAAAATRDSLRELLRQLFTSQPLVDTNGEGVGGGTGELGEQGEPGVVVAGIAHPMVTADVEASREGELEGSAGVGAGGKVRVWVTLCAWEDEEEMVLVVPHYSALRLPAYWCPLSELCVGLTSVVAHESAPPGCLVLRAPRAPTPLLSILCLRGLLDGLAPLHDFVMLLESFGPNAMEETRDPGEK